MQRSLMVLLLCGLGALLPACAPLRPFTSSPPARPPLPVAMDGVTVQTEGAFVLVRLAYTNPTATPLTIGLQQWANARTHLEDDTHQSYTLLATFGIGYGDDRQDWLALAPQGHATVSFLFWAEDPAATPPTRYTLTSGQQMRSGDATTIVPFTLSLSQSVPRREP
jgi:hypothetical protein